MSKSCSRCSAIIPNGRNYCDAHYLQAMEEYKEKEEKARLALQKYEESLVKYNEDMEVWNNLTPAEREEADKKAEEASMVRYQVIFSAIIGVLSGVYFNSWLVFIGLTIAVLFALHALGESLKKKIAKLLRAFVYGSGYTLVFVIIMKFIGVLGPTDSIFMKFIQIAVFVGPMILSFYLEFKGLHHASGAPKKPTKPMKVTNRKPSP